MTVSFFSFFDCKDYRYATYTRSAIYIFFYINSTETRVDIYFRSRHVLTSVARIIYTLYNILTHEDENPHDWEDDKSDWGMMRILWSLHLL